MITIIDYGMGNLFSVTNTLTSLGAQYQITDDAQTVATSHVLLLPGVGSFRTAMQAMEAKGLNTAIQTAVSNGAHLLGICLGMQLLLDESSEEEPTKGLGLIPGMVCRFTEIAPFDATLKVPHMGWNNIQANEHHSPYCAEGHVYFVHSYVAQLDEQYILASADYSITVPAIIGRGNVIGMQFHPEKSGPVGMQLLTTWLQNVTKEMMV
ncbi:MAG: imidazole glycerol phosphate synthase subunit HisH [Bacilli bacterium]